MASPARGTNAALRRRIERLVALWRPVLGLESWKIELRFDERGPSGACVASPHYQEAILYFYPPRIPQEITTQDFDGIEDMVVHELVHCVIWRSSERAVTQVARSLQRARALGRQRRRKAE